MPYICNDSPFTHSIRLARPLKNHVCKYYFVIRSESYSIKSKEELFDATQKIGQWREFCKYLGVSERVLVELDDNGKSVSEKKHDCLTDYFNNHNPNWRKVVSVVANFPIRNLREACKIAKKYMKMERRECEKQFKPQNEDSMRDDTPGM